MEEPIPYEKENTLAGIGDIDFEFDYDFLKPIVKKEGILLDVIQNKYSLYYIPSTDQVVNLFDQRYTLEGSFNHPRFDKYRDKVKSVA